MTADEFADAARARNETALSRLGSSKSIYADTRGEMEPDAVLAAAATAHHHAAETFAAWADDADAGTDDADAGAAEAWDAAAATEREAAEELAAALDEFEPGPVPAVQAAIRDHDTTVERAGATVGWALALGKKAEQATGFFVGQADPGTADLFRDVRETVDAQRERAGEVLTAACEGDADREAALAAADDAVQAAYDEYVETLEELGVNPKPVC